MRYRFTLPGRTSVTLAVCVTLTGLLSTPALAAPPPRHVITATATATAPATTASRPATPPPAGPAADTTDHPALQNRPLAAAQLPPLQSATPTTRPGKENGRRATPKSASCSPADFAGRTGSALVTFVEASTTGCVNSLFAVTGTDAGGVFRQAQMVTVARAFRQEARRYQGDNSGGVWQLVLFLRAGYYVQFNHPDDVGPYGTPLARAITSGLDAFFANQRSQDVTPANGDVLGEAVVLTDSADQQARYLTEYQRLLDAYDSSYDAVDSMVAAVNDVYTPLWRGNWNPAYVDAVTADPGVVQTLRAFALAHLDLLGTDRAYLDSNAGMNVARYVEHAALRDTVRPLAKDLLDASQITGPTAGLWVAVATQADAYDRADCAYYGICDLPARLTDAALPITHTCDATHTVRAQALTPADLDAVCAQLRAQDPYFEDVVKGDGPIPGQYLSTVELVVFGSRADYRTYAGAIYGVSTDNGGITLTGDPSDPANQPLSIMYQKETDDGFPARVWNLNHEYTHVLDARYDMKGDFAQQTSVPDVWWIEGLAEYVSYGYRGRTDEQAVAEAGRHTYRLSTLFQNTYANSDVTRTYPWGYLAVRYMAERHPADIQRMLARFRVGDYPGGHAVYATGVGTRYDADFDQWLTACAAGACVEPGHSHSGARTS
ncbi:collagenase [Streptomyces sp. NPDC050534]|uniref:collagenase n=1 Tax=Streptomyces sp. NPDC050534 TaxID=3365625 RepID=UPI0037B52370